MSVEALAVFLIISDSQTGEVYKRFHNALARNDDGSIKTKYTTSFVEGTMQGYSYIPFVYQGGTLNRNGDNITAGLAMAPNEISMQHAAQMTQTVSADGRERYPMTVRAILMRMEPDRFKPIQGGVVTDEVWVAAAMTYTADALEITLSSAIDAVNALAPSYSLNRMNVGQLPVTGSLRV